MRYYYRFSRILQPTILIASMLFGFLAIQIVQLGFAYVQQSGRTTGLPISDSFSSIIVAPIIEELLFRLPVFLIAWRSIKNGLIAAIISSLIFGPLHVFTALNLKPSGIDTIHSLIFVSAYIIGASLIGFILCLYVIVHRKNGYYAILGSMALHSLTNFLAIIGFVI